ncbi:HEAT repeat domain-containing protein [Halalkalibacterium halodurans]|uniref:BH2232 protein n=1 Tax=Halalkalibacterium halodurans (strain ATCC BAA-125 / DSM 18197 / FERM 7344 / JCM 9153 / C-125) TaxID=272558 RepID=Q9KAQ5_HALH5|nr:HEAT repeat domain-containing protein [Halalkalibacterium halodurans]MDY7222785.1 HEAT repeat domain-containing protein [Halalkalibacterium halodurans]MDY7242006.1 HEAT repeat domain-containing protein [Halalkalibacterium halodurans]MED4080983.1 HEAT repeat domain-containing protein [Halalkalibacterium halodurans]MED4085166.1 HEAT repeat domain-containing protein [Halalkalibacterium halodurans]MED4105256.1 HEAT repeat domain-containing protein [Halalkalibacterium halodurans]
MGNAIVWLTIAILSFMAVLILLFIYLVVQRMIEVRVQRKIADYVKDGSDWAYRYLIEGDAPAEQIIPDSSTKLIAMEKILRSYAKNISSDMVSARITDYAHQFLSPYYSKNLNSLNWSTRMNTLHRILEFRMKDLLDDVLNMLNENKHYSDDEYLQIYRILAAFQYEDFLQHLLNPKIEMNEMEYRKLLFELEEKPFLNMVEHYQDFPSALKHTVLDMIGVKHLVQMVPFLEERIHDEELEVRVRSLKALSQLGIVQNEKIYYPFVESENWEERMMVAKILANVDSPEAVSSLQHLLKDQSWWVRSQAAQSIVQQKNGKSVLRAIVETEEDPYAKDIGKEALGM